MGGSPGTPDDGITAEVVRVESLAQLRTLIQRAGRANRLCGLPYAAREGWRGLFNGIAYSFLCTLRSCRTRRGRNAHPLCGHLAPPGSAYGQYAEERYPGNDFHHTPDDTLDKVDRADLNQSVAAYVTTAFAAATAPGDFGRIEPDLRPAGACSAADDDWES